MTKLRERHISGKIDKMPPEVAATVIKDYILPMFEADCRKQTMTKRLTERGLQHKGSGLEVVHGTLYGDIKLSDRLSDQLSVLKRERNDLSQQLNDQIHSKESFRMEAERYKAELVDLQTRLHTSNSFTEGLQSQLQTSSLHSSRLRDEVEAMTDQYKTEVSEHSALKEKYIEVLKDRENLKYSNLTLKQEKELLDTQFEMIAGNLKNLQLLMKGISSYKMRTAKTNSEQLMIGRDFKRCKEWGDFLCTEYEKIYMLRKAELLSLSLLDGAFSQISAQREKTIKYLSKKNSKLEGRISAIYKENEDLRNSLGDMNGKVDTLTTEFRKLFTKYSMQKKQRKNTYEKCRRCDQVYIEGDNFNWSCRVHTSTFGVFWLCCGQTARKAKGCSVSKHLPKDEIEQLGVDGEAKAVARERCKGCNQTGHDFNSCFNDPNRIFSTLQDLNADKKQAKFGTISTDSLAILKAKLGNTVMTDDCVSTPSSSSEADEEQDSFDRSVKDKLRDTMKIRTTISNLADRRRSMSLNLKLLDKQQEEEATAPTLERLVLQFD
jgi:hypothetical protein